jgi:hypothetical protein
MKTVAALLIVLAAIIGAVVFWLSGNMDSLMKTAIGDYGGAMTQAKVSVGAVKIAPVDGKGTDSRQPTRSRLARSTSTSTSPRLRGTSSSSATLPSMLPT